MAKIPITPEGYKSVEEEVKQLKTVDRPNVIKAISEAREHGDLSENAEYHSARELQGHIEARIKDLDAIISLAEIIDVSKLSGAIKFGATVEMVDEDTDEKRKLKIVGEYEADIEKNLININSPIARALIGKEEGDTAQVRTPGGMKYYEILSVIYK